jgi:hypothetical protein
MELHAAEKRLDEDHLNGIEPPTLEGFRGFLIHGAVQSGVADYNALN